MGSLGTIRARVTAIATVLAAVLLGGTAWLLVAVLCDQLTDNLDEGLVQRAATIADLLAVDPSPDLNTDEDLLVQVVAPGGGVIAASANFDGDVPLGPPASGIRTSRDVAGRAESFRVLTDDVDTAAGPATLHVAVNRDDIDDPVRIVSRLLAAAVPAVTALLGLLTWWLTGRTLRPVDAMRAELGEITGTDLRRRVTGPATDDEIGRLARTMNETLDRLHDAVQQQQRFVADASHELRTPLTSIRGYSELFRRGADQRPEDLEKVMRRIEDEAARMGILVDDLLLLARLDQGRPLEREPVDLTNLATDAVEDARVVAADHVVSFEGDGPVVVLGDAHRLRQVLGNLIANACTHTPAGTLVTVRVASTGDEAILEVADRGPGLAAGEAEHVFERFWRADPSRTRASGGAGLGLSIVAAIAAAHGGRAEVDSEPGAGATFRVRLPLDGQAPPHPTG
jgi:two-component system OmpR family sensor kinase